MVTRNPALEQAIAASPDDPAPFLVYADWLTAQGDPRGELIIVQHDLSKGASDTLEAREAELLAEGFFGGPVDPELATFTWRWGFVRGVRLFNFVDWMDSSYDVAPLVQRIFTAPVAAFASELRLGVIRWMENGEDVPAILSAVAELGAAERIETLVLGDVHDIDCDLAHHPLGAIDMLGEAYPNLTSLVVHGSDFSLGERLSLPALRTLTVETCGLSKEDVTAIASASWPQLEELTLWFGSEDYGSTASVEDLAPLLSGANTPRLRRLGLANCEFASDICAALPGSPVLAQLSELDLSMGTLGDESADVLAAMSGELAHLEKLDLRESYLTERGIGVVRALDCPVDVSDQKEIEPDDPEWRYVSAGE